MPNLHSRRRLLPAATLVVLSALPGVTRPAHAQAIPTDSAIRAILRTRVDSGAAVGFVVGILENGRRRYVAYGSAGRARPPLDEHTLFEIGSISKTFTALLLADATLRNEVELDQPVVDLLPRGTVVPSRGGRQITLAHLATHRSGLPGMPTNFEPANPADPFADYDAKRLYAFLGGHELRHTPGEDTEYSNLGGGLLGHALVLRTGSPSWGALVERRVTGPLGMHETFVEPPPSLRSRVAAGHDLLLDTVPAWHLDVLAGAGALRSSARDMLTYLAAQLDTVQGPLAHAVALARVPRAPFAATMRIGLGWLISGSDSRPIYWHNGGTAGFRTFAAFDPARNAAVVVLSNTGVTVDDLGMHLLNPALLVAIPVRPPKALVTLSNAELDRLVGEYPLSPVFTLAITREGDSLYVQATGQPRFLLTATSANRFVIPQVNAELVFDTSERGPARHISLRQNGGMITGARRP